MPKKSSAKRSSSRTRSKKRSTKSTGSVLTKAFLHQEQMEFYKKHPNAKLLLTIFIALAVAALALTFYRYGVQPANGYYVGY